VSAVPSPIILDELFARVESGISAGGGFERVQSEAMEIGGVLGRMHRFQNDALTFLGAVAYADGFVHTFAVVGPSNRALEVQRRFNALNKSFRVERIEAH
ncbi:MAG: hypothetical protein AAFQ82_22480, partial [Myxococcota bacterium]